MNAVADTLRKAADLCAQGWTQCALARNRHGLRCGLRSKQAVKWCAIGAIRRSSPTPGVSALAQGSVERRLARRWCMSLSFFNDQPGRKKSAVVAALRAAAAQRLPGVNLHFGSLDDFARAIAKENPQLPTVRGDMPDTWIHGWMSMPVEAKISRNTRPLQPVMDILDTELRAWGQQTADLAPALARAYELGNLHSEHTFGPAAPDSDSWSSGTPLDLYGDEWRSARGRGPYKKY